MFARPANEKRGTIDFSELYQEEVTKNSKGKPIRIKTIGQREYVNAIKQHDLVLGLDLPVRVKLFGRCLGRQCTEEKSRSFIDRRWRPGKFRFLPGDLKKVDHSGRYMMPSMMFGVEHTES